MTDNLFDLTAEKAVVGAVLFAPETMLELPNTGIGAEDFSDPILRCLFLACCNLWQKGANISALAVLQELEHVEQAKDLDAAKIPDALGEAAALGPIWASNIAASALNVHEFAVKRRLFAICMETQRQCKENVGIHSIVDGIQLALSGLSYGSSLTRYVLFRDGVEIGGEKPIYEFNVVRPSDMTTARIRINSDQIDKRPEVRRIIREALHINPRLQPPEKWEDFVHDMVVNTSKMEMPEAAKRDNPFLYWLREWYKTASPAETIDDLINGYVIKGDYIYIQPQRVQKWLLDHAKIQKTITELWAVLQGYGAKRDVSIRLKDKPRRLWGIPMDVINPKEDEQMSLTSEAEESTEMEPVETVDLDEYPNGD